MPEITTKPISSVASAYESLPEPIREWLSSEATILGVSEINKRLGFKDEKKRIIPRLVLRLTTQDLDPMDFINELSYELNISFQNAKTVTQEIEEKIFKPIESELKKDLNLDFKLVYFGNPSVKKPAEIFAPAGESEQSAMPSLPQQPAENESIPAAEASAPEPGPVKSLPEVNIPNLPIESESNEAEKPIMSSIPAPMPVEPAMFEIETLKKEIKTEKEPPKSFLKSAMSRLFSKKEESDQPATEPVIAETPTPIKEEIKQEAPAIEPAAISSISSEKVIAPFTLTDKKPIAQAAEEQPASPFIIHEENNAKPIISQLSKETPSLGLNVSHRDFFQEKSQSSPKAVSIKLETSLPESEKDKIRVVHYSDFKSPVNNFDSEQKIEVNKNPGSSDSKSKPFGNTVDLRENLK
ncbi:MAG: hypothetical protein PHN74_03535 [Candidatus Pacebacteria bacterium]|nr:hypothetical protein [Candidatus Paceibacterota bacterium]